MQRAPRRVGRRSAAPPPGAGPRARPATVDRLGDVLAVMGACSRARVRAHGAQNSRHGQGGEMGSEDWPFGEGCVAFTRVPLSPLPIISLPPIKAKPTGFATPLATDIPRQSSRRDPLKRLRRRGQLRVTNFPWLTRTPQIKIPPAARGVLDAQVGHLAWREFFAATPGTSPR